MGVEEGQVEACAEEAEEGYVFIHCQHKYDMEVIVGCWNGQGSRQPTGGHLLQSNVNSV